MRLRLLCLLLGLLLALPACEPAPYPELVPFAFVIPLRISPGADTVARGDTLWLTADFSDSLLDLRSNRRHRLRQQDLALTSSVGFRKLLGPGQSPGSFVQGFATVNRVGQLLPGGSTFRRFEPAYDGQRYRARIGIVPQVPGVFALNMLSTVRAPSPLPLLQVSPGPDGRPRRASLVGVYYVINDGNTHFDLQRQHSHVTADQPGAPEASIYYEQKGTFTFVVR